MNEARRRQRARQAIRGEIRLLGMVPHHICGKDAHAIMDDLARKEPDLAVSRWYLGAKDYSIKAWIREWERWYRDEVRREKEESQIQKLMAGGKDG